MKSEHSVLPRALALLTGLALLVSVLFAQTPPNKTEPQQQGMGGVSTGTPVNYTSKRTVGITDPKFLIAVLSPVIFEDVTQVVRSVLGRLIVR